MRVLVVDDEPDITEVVSLSFSLGWPGSEVAHAANGEQGLDAARREAPDLVILDVGLPGIDGFQVLEQLRGFSNVPVIMLTASHDDADRVRGFELGANDYITKPFSHVELLARAQALGTVCK